MDNYRIATAEDFEVKPEAVQLPSQKDTDKAVLLKRTDFISAMAGKEDVPDMLGKLILSQMQSQRTDFALTEQNIPELIKAINFIAVRSFEQPKLWDGDHEKDGLTPVNWLSLQDRIFVFSWALGVKYQPVESEAEKDG